MAAPLVAQRDDHLLITPGGPLTGTGQVPGDKSISHRLLMIGACASSALAASNLSPSTDVAATRSCLAALGVVIDDGPASSTVVHGRGLNGLAGPPVTLHCGRSGTTMRLLAGLLASQARQFVLTGEPQLLARPMQRVIDPLRAMGADIESTSGRAPLYGQGQPLNGARIDLAIASAQVGSSVLLAGLGAAAAVEVHYGRPVRDHTERLLRRCGAPVTWDGRTSRLAAPVAALHPPAWELAVPGDGSAAAFLLAAAAVTPGSLVAIDAMTLNPGRTGLLDILSAMGAHVAISQPDDAPRSNRNHASISQPDHAPRSNRNHSSISQPDDAPRSNRNHASRSNVAQEWEPRGDVRVRHGPLNGTVVQGDLVPCAIDELPLVAVLGAVARGRTEVRDAAELRVKETDRIAAVAEGLERLGARITTRADGFTIHGGAILRGADLDGHGDHRVVMALAVAALAARGPSRIRGASVVGDSFPGFVGAMNALATNMVPT